MEASDNLLYSNFNLRRLGLEEFSGNLLPKESMVAGRRDSSLDNEVLCGTWPCAMT
jgi:hypothetical protein